MARKDIEIRVRARDDASRNAKKIADALKLIGADGKKASDSASKLGSSFSALTADVSRLKAQTDALSSFGKIVGQMERAGDSVTRLGNQLAGAAKGFEFVRARSQEAANASAEITARLKAEESALASRNVDLTNATKALQAQAAALRELAKAQDVLNGKTRKGVTAGGSSATAGVGIETGAPQSSARASFGAFLAADVAAAEAAKAQLQGTVAGLKASIDSSQKSITDLAVELKAATANEKEFSKETLEAGNAILSLRADLAKAQGKLSGLEEEVLQANKSLGVLAFSQEEVAAAAARATEELRQQERALAVFEKFAGKNLVGGGTITDATSAERANRQAEAMRNAREELEILRAEQAKLDAALKSSSGNVTAQVDAYNRMSKAVKLAEEQIRKLEIAQRLSESTGQKTGYGRWVAAYDKSTRQAAAATDNFTSASNRAGGALGRMGPQVIRVSQGKRQLSADTDRATRSLALFGNETRTTLSFMQRMRGEVIALAASYIGLFGAYQRVAEAANAFRAVERAQQNLGVAFNGDIAKVAQEMAFLNAEADRLGFTFETLANGYGKLSVGAQNAGFSIAETRQLFLSIIEASRVSGQSIEQTNGILRAFDQILSKGKIQAEELRGQLGDRMTGAFKLFADALGVTTAELDAMMKKGEVLADRDTLIKVAERLSEVYSGQLPQALASVGFAIDSFQRSIEKINLLLAEGLVDSIKEASASLAAFVNSSEGQATFRSIGEAAGALISILAQIPEYLDLIVLAAKVLISVKIAQWVAQFGGTITTAIGAMGAFNRELTLVGPRVQQLSGAQATLATALSTANGAISNGQRRLRSYNTTTALSRGAVVGLTGALGVLRGAMFVVAGAARAMWAAIGGPIGAAAIGVSLIFATWSSDADAATTALQEHERQVELVRQAYAHAQGNVEDWSTELQGLTQLDAQNSLNKLTTSYQNALTDIAYEARIVEYLLREALAGGDLTDQGYLDDLQALEKAIAGIEGGVVPIDQIKQSLSDLALGSSSEGIRQIAESLNNTINAADDSGSSIAALSKAMASARAILQGFSKDTKEAAEEALGLNEVVDDTNTSFENKAPLEEYSKAIDDLKSKIPSLAAEMERLQKTTELNAAAWTALVAAWNSGDFSKIKEVASLWLKGFTENALGDVVGQLSEAGGAGGAAAALIKRFEGYSETPYWDVNAYRAGYGSDTTTLADGTIMRIVEGMTVTLADSERDLARRIAEFQNVVMGQIGADRFASFDQNQQAVLTSLAYNYGSLPERILDAVRSGDSEAIAEAIRGLAGDNNGINANRRNLEASVFEQGGDANFNTMVEAEREAIELRKEGADATKQRLADLDAEIAQQALINAGKEREAAIEEALRQARAENPNITEEELARIREKTGLLFDQQNATKGIELAEERVNQLYELRAQLAEQMKMAQANGDAAGVEALRLEIEGVDLKLKEAIASAIAMWQAIGGPEADAAIAKLQTMSMSLQNSQTKVGSFGLSMDTWYGIFQGAVQGIVGAFEAFAQAIANGENAFAAFGRAALQVLAQVLQQIAAAIIQMQILKMLQGFGGGIGKFATMMLGNMTAHTGGVVGSAAVGAGNRIGRPQWMRAALTYHTGGMAGFAPDEVSATLKRGEEVLTEEDPRHRFNLGGSSSSSKGDRLTQVLAIGEKQVQEMLNRYGSDAVLTHIKTNAPTIRRMLGV